jgi:membrane-bound serine protease (ClpP class)
MGLQEQLLLAGLVLFGLEAAVPGFGICGIGGILCFTVAAYMYLGGGAGAVLVIAAAYAVGLALLYLLCTRLPAESRWNPLILLERQRGGKEAAALPDKTDYTGQEGEALTLLRPAGVVLLGGRRVDALSEGDFIPAGTKVKVSRVEGSKVFVERA